MIVMITLIQSFQNQRNHKNHLKISGQNLTFNPNKKLVGACGKK
jgi:hypothetical protein